MTMAALWCAWGQPVQETRTIQRSFGPAARLEIDNIDGSIRVIAGVEQQIRMTVVETLDGDSKDDLEQARRDVKLDITEKDGTVRLYVDAPFRCQCDGWQRSSRRYRVKYDFELHVPSETFLALKTVNRGDIKVENPAGDYEIHNVNGGVEMLEVSGSGRAYALNKPLKVVFRANPRKNSYFGSLNGKVHLYFVRDLAADFRIKTFNGKVYSDFPMTALPPKPALLDRRDGKTVYRADPFTGARAGAGGVEIRLDGFNGDLHILNTSEHD